MTMALRSKNKLHFINGSLPRPLDEEHDSFAWDRCNIMIMPWLHNSVELEIAQSVLWMDTAVGIWNELMDHFYQGDVFRISDLQEEICNLKQDVVKICTYKDGDQVIRFLKGLNDHNSATRSQIMLMEALPTIYRVYSLLVQQERKAILPLDESKVLAFPNIQPQHNAPKSNGNFHGRSIRGGKYSGARGRGPSDTYTSHNRSHSPPHPIHTELIHHNTLMPTPPHSSNHNSHEINTNPQGPLPIIQFTRQTKPHTYLKDYQCNLISLQSHFRNNCFHPSSQCGTDLAEINQLKTLLNAKFSIKEPQVLKYFLGFEVSRTAQGSSLL
ncbi:hypothetical protein KIW84_051092 [Lathyrus oleraceus]|uniref:Uncharacterized protein n=1 Tax=Pisum sativum TaxID=3888 RepID=A0A9D4WLK3_PEA|nr:hypothetical protein KIW84_051092 [Pisum sativum]